MTGRDYLGEFEQLVLLAILRLEDDAYGMRVRSEIATRTGRDVTIGAVYATLDRLLDKGYVSARIGEATAERGGRAKKVFRLTPAGSEALERTLAALRRMTDGLAVDHA